MSEPHSTSASPAEPLAIVGYACRLPGGITDGTSYWQLLEERRDAVTEIPEDRWSHLAYSSGPGKNGKSASRWGGFLDKIDQFEPGLFGISPREAQYIDPQQRLLLETTAEALEHAGIPAESLAGSRTGVFVGISTGDYGQIQRDRQSQRGLSAFTAQGSSLSIAANRISYCLDLRGPSFIVDTACSSALMAFDRGCKSLLDRESDMIIVGGVNIIINPETFISFSAASMLSPDGRCKAFDASGNGFVRAEGGGAIVVKRLSDAVRDHDPIQAIVLGSGANQDGRTGGISMPNPDAQEALLREVYHNSQVDPASVRYVEAHGTGTVVGDPAETTALGRVFSEGRTAEKPLIIGSVKTNIGHMEAASGIASLVKAILVLQKRQIPANLHFKEPNPYIPFEEFKLRVPTEMEAWPDDKPGVIGINSFGFGGANAHVILADPSHERTQLFSEHSPQISSSNGHAGTNGSAEKNGTHKKSNEVPFPMMITARSADALRQRANDFRTFLADSSNGSLNDIAFTSQLRRSHYSHRLGLVAKNADEARETLSAFLDEETRPNLHTAEAKQDEQGLVFVFCGQGPQAAQMGMDLYRREPVFRKAMDEIDTILKDVVEWSLIEELSKDDESSQIHLTSVAQPALFAIHVGLARLWESWGVKPAAVVGHSVGEIAAAHIAGLVSLEDAVKIIGYRGISLQEHALPGRMLAAALTEADARRIIAEFEPKVCVAAINSPDMVTLAGEAEALEAVGKELDSREIWWKALRVKHAFHSHLVAPAEESFMEAIGNVVHSEPTCEMVCTVTGEKVGEDGLSADYWWDNIRQPVRFAPAIETLQDMGYSNFLEIGPHPVLSASIKQCRRADSPMPTVFPSLVRKEDDQQTIRGTFVGLQTHGIDVDPSAFWPTGGTVVSLPRHPWLHERFWHESADSRESRLRPNYHPMLGQSAMTAEHTWHNSLDVSVFDWLVDHKAGGQVIVPAAGFVEMFIAAALRTEQAESITIDDVDMLRALFLPNEAAPLTQVSADPGSGTLFVSSRMNESDEVWTKHSQAMYRPRPKLEPKPLDLDAWRKTSEPSSVEEFYATFRRMDLEYGPAFVGVRELHRGDEAALGRIELDESMLNRADLYHVHPALLDACFQVLLEAIPVENRTEGRMFLPERIGRVHFHRSPGTSAYSEVTLKASSAMQVTGDIRIFTTDGEPAIDILDFRCQAVISQRERERNDISSCLHQTRWHHAPLPGSPVIAEPLTQTKSLAELVESAESVAANTWHDIPATIIGDSADAQDRVARPYFLNALQQMGFELKAGETIDSQALADSGKLIEKHRPLFERCLDRLVATGELTKTADAWQIVSDFAEPDVNAAWLDALAELPELYPHLRLIEVCGEDLAGVFSGEVDPLKLLFSEESVGLLEQVYRDQYWTRYGNTFIQRLAVELRNRLPESRPLRILEVGAGTGGTTAYMLPMLPDHQTEYWFTDLSQYFLSRAEDQFRNSECVRYAKFDLEKDPADQDLPTGCFDIVIAADAIHGVTDLKAALGRCSDLLVDGGLLVLRELTQTRMGFDLVFGLTDGWWNYQQDPARDASPLLTTSEWNKLLTETGWESPSLPATCDEVGHHAAVIVARQPNRTETKPPSVFIADKPPKEPNWLIFGDGGAEGRTLVDQLRHAGRRCVTVRDGAEFDLLDSDEFQINPANREDFEQLKSAIGFRGNDWSIVHLTASDTDSADTTMSGLESLDDHASHSVMHLLQVFAADENQSPRRLLLVTRGARDVGESTDAIGPLQGGLIGLGRSTASEYRHIAVRQIDLDPSEGDENTLWAELCADDPQSEVAWRGPHRLVPRLEQLDPRTETIDAESANDIPFRLNFARPGDLGSLELVETHPAPMGPDDVQMDVHFVALNFRDILRALGRFPADDLAQIEPGDECSGVVRSVGANVKHVKPGDRVVACTAGSFRSVLTVAGVRVAKVPNHLSLSAAVSMPVAYITVDYALRNVGRMQKGESILIHSAAGGVGMAAMHISRRLGLDIYATAGTDPKRKLLPKYGVKRIMNSRSLDFYDETLCSTDGRGVDAVLNSLAGKAMVRSLSCLAPYGRFLELGKRDFFENTRVGLWPFRRNVAYHAVDLSAMVGSDPESTMAILNNLFDESAEGHLSPLPTRVLPVARVQEAFRLMGQGVHIGKVVLDLTQHWGQIRRTETKPPVRSDATYLVTGAFGGAGQEVAKWLVDHGAKNLLLVSRSGPKTDAAKAFVADLESRDVTVKAECCDITDETRMAEVLKESQSTMPALGGVFHLAMVIDDAVINDLNTDRFKTVTRPKSHAAWVLHRLTKDMPLDLFVLFSSASATVGNFGQGNYAAANASLEALADHRRRLGLPATAIGWGVLGEVGYVAEREDLGDSLAKLGFTAMSVEDIRKTLDATTPAANSTFVSVRADWQVLASKFRNLQNTPGLLTHLLASQSEGGDGDASQGIRDAIVSADAKERPTKIREFLRGRVGRVLGMSPSKLPMDRPLSEMGLDSLMGVELASIIESDLGVAVPMSALSKDMTIERLAGTLLQSLMGTSEDEVVETESATPSAPVHESPLVSLRKGTANASPLFVFHPAGGELRIYDDLLPQLSGEFSVFGLQATEVADNETTESLARQYAQAIVQEHSDGPVRLFGFSLGGLLAARTAIQLEELGRTVEFLGIVESNPAELDSSDQKERQLQKFLVETYELIRQETGMVVELDADRLERETAEVAAHFDSTAVMNWLLDGGHLSPGVPEDLVAEYLRRIGVHLAMMSNDPGIPQSKLSVPLHLWSATNGLGAAESSWNRWTSQECVHSELDAEHFSIMFPPQVSELASQLEAALATADSEAAFAAAGAARRGNRS